MRSRTGEFVNDLERGNVVGKKVNSSDEPLENAVFGLFFSDCTEFTTNNAILTDTSDSEGNFGFENVTFGEYIVREIEAPTGYILSDESYTVTVNKDSNPVEIKAVNNEIRGNVTVTKIDEEYPNNKLSGAEFTVYSDMECTNEIAKLSETEKGIYTLSDLEFGEYFLKETVAPDGFIIDENVYPFSIVNDGETVEVSNTEVGEGFVNKPEEGSVEITKTDISTGELIPDCGIEILDKDGNVILQGRTDEKGVVTFEKLRTGEYFYREFDAPEGYILDETKYPFTISENGEIVKCEMTNTKLTENPPYTGDSSSDIIAWLMIGLAAVVGVCAFIGRKKKGDENEK